MKSLFAFFLLFSSTGNFDRIIHTKKKYKVPMDFFYNNKKFFQLTEKTLSRFLIVQQKRKDEIEVKRAKVLTYCVQV